MFDHNLIYKKILNGLFLQILQFLHNSIRQIDCWEYFDQVYYQGYQSKVWRKSITCKSKYLGIYQART